MKATNLNLTITISSHNTPVTHVCSSSQLIIKIISTKHHSCVADPTTNYVDKSLNKKKKINKNNKKWGHLLSGIYTSETF
jgi:hypothetical protein